MIHYNDAIMSEMASQITGVSIVCSTVCSGADQRKHQSSASLVFVRGIHRWAVNSPHKGPVTRKMFSFDDVIMACRSFWILVRNSPISQFHATLVPYPTIHHSEQECAHFRSEWCIVGYLYHIPQYIIQNRNVNIFVLSDVSWDMGQVHCGIYEIGLMIPTGTRFDEWRQVIKQFHIFHCQPWPHWWGDLHIPGADSI